MENSLNSLIIANLLDKIKIAGGVNASGEALYNLDNDLQTKSDDVALAEEKTALNP